MTDRLPMGPDHEGAALLSVTGLTQEFRTRGGERVRAVTDVSFDVRQFETFGLVGESGCGKSTTVRAILQDPRPASGAVLFNGQDLTSLGPAELRAARREIQMVFQDPFSSLNPRWRVRQSVVEPLRARKVASSRAKRDELADEMLAKVGLDPTRFGDRRPAELSGGQCQRVAIARALVASPRLVIFDEAVSSLDVSIQAQVLNLLEDLRSELGLTSIFIAHDLAVVKQVSDRVGVMFRGALCEVGPAEALYESPAHPYTAALIEAVPTAEPRRRRGGTGHRVDAPAGHPAPAGCRFSSRCPHVRERCLEEAPGMRQVGRDHVVACHFPLGRVPASDGSTTLVDVVGHST